MDYIFGCYFWDDDYNLDPRIINRPDIVAVMDVSEEAIHACNRMRPQPHEIELKEWVDEDPSRFGSACDILANENPSNAELFEAIKAAFNVVMEINNEA